MEEKPLKKVAFYIRVSTEEQAHDDKYGKKNQLEALEALVKSKSASMLLAGEQYVYFDDISGTKDIRERPAFRRLMQDVTNAPTNEKPFDVVAVYKIDRFARKLRVLLETIDWFEQYNLEFVSVHESIDTSTPFGKAMLGIIGVISELEIENIKIRTHGGRLIAAKEGKYLGRIPPFGYKKDINGKLIILDEEAKIVKLIFNLFLKENLNTQQIAKYLKDNNILSPVASAVLYGKLNTKKTHKKYANNFWQERTVRRLLSEDIYIGNYYYNRTKTVKKKQVHIPRNEWLLSNYHHTKIIDLFQFKQVQEMLVDKKKNNTNYGTNTEHIYLLSGILKCATCYHSDIDKGNPQNWIGSKKEIEKGKQNYTYMYTCRRRNLKKTDIVCTTIPLPAKEIEEYVINFIRELFQNPTDTFNYYKNLESSQLQKKEDEKRLKELNKLIDSYADTKEILLQQNKKGLINMDKLVADIAELDADHKRNLEYREEVALRIAKTEISAGYSMVFETFKSNYLNHFETILSDRQKTQNLLKLLVKEIIVSSRAVNKDDRIAGRKKEGQTLPSKLLIKLRLPNEILDGFIRDTNSKVRSVVRIGSGQTDIYGARGQT